MSQNKSRIIQVGLMSRIERSYENYEIYDNSQHHWQNQRNLFKVLQGRPIESYENCENYEIYENCEIYNNSPYHLQNQRNLFKGLQGRPMESYEIYENCEIYDNSPYHYGRPFVSIFAKSNSLSLNLNSLSLNSIRCR